MFEVYLNAASEAFELRADREDCDVVIEHVADIMGLDIDD